MTRSGGCLVRFDPASTPVDSEDLGAELVRHVTELTDQWVAIISSAIGRGPAAPIVITLRPGGGLSQTKGSQILLPFDPQAADVHRALTTVNACLAHELVHAVAGRLETHLINEGFAVHIDSTLRLAGPAWPFYDLPPHRWVAIFREEGTFLPLDQLVSASDVGTPRSGDEAAPVTVARARYYLEAGSYAGFLTDHLGMDRFLATFRSGASIPEGADVASLQESWLAAVGGPPTAEEWSRRDASIARWAGEQPSERARAGT